MAEPIPPSTYEPPPLTLWGHLWRYAVTLGFSLFIWLNSLSAQLERRYLIYLEIPLGIASFVLVHFRRRWPLRIALIVTVLGAFTFTPNGPSNLAAVSLATHREWRKLALFFVVSMVCALTLTYAEPMVGATRLEVMGTAFALIVATIGWGAYIGSRRELIWNLRRRATEAEAQADLLAQQARDTERARIAREMHDVLAHRITQVSLQSGALAYRKDLSADDLRDGADVIRVQANRALEELRGVLGVLRDGDGELIDRPQPTFGDVPDLVQEAQGAGMKVSYSSSVSSTPTDVLGRAIYRFIQEALTNASKHAPGASVTIEVSGGSRDGVSILVRNPLGFGTSSTPDSGFGLVGLRERVELAGGRLQARSDHRSFELSGWLPWT